MDPADQYLRLVKLGRDVFVQSVAPASLVRVRGDLAAGVEDSARDQSIELDTETFVGNDQGKRRPSRRIEIYPLVKKPSAPFPDMITVGRTPNNDIVLRDATVSRLHAFFRHKDGRWYVADGGSKNGTFLEGTPLPARKDREIDSGQGVRIGDLAMTFYTAEELFKMLSLVTK